MRRLGLAAASLQAALALGFGVLASQRPFPDPPEPVPRGLAFALLFALPAVIGTLGALAGRRSIVLAGAVVSTLAALVGFGTTLIFMVPAILYAAAAADSGEPRRRPVSPWRLLFVLVAIPVVVGAVFAIGLLVVPALLLLVAALAGARRSRPWMTRASTLAVTTAMAIVLLALGAGWALLTMTETRCWVAYGTPGDAVYERVPDTNQINLSVAAIAGGCDTGELTARGALIAAGLAGAAIGLAAVSASAAVRSQPSAA